MKEHDDVDRLILKAADIIEKQGSIKHTLGTATGRLCIYGSLKVASGEVDTTHPGGYSGSFLANPVGKEAEKRLKAAWHAEVCDFNNTHDQDHIVASMRAVANGESLPVEKQAA